MQIMEKNYILSDSLGPHKLTHNHLQILPWAPVQWEPFCLFLWTLFGDWYDYVQNISYFGDAKFWSSLCKIRQVWPSCRSTDHVGNHWKLQTVLLTENIKVQTHIWHHSFPISNLMNIVGMYVSKRWRCLWKFPQNGISNTLVAPLQLGMATQTPLPSLNNQIFHHFQQYCTWLVYRLLSPPCDVLWSWSSIKMWTPWYIAWNSMPIGSHR